MGEVVHLSFGPQANNLNASFYNSQESYFVYTPAEAAQSRVNPHVRFVYGKEFTPRAVFWDFRNGLGNWHRFLEKYEESQSHELIVQNQGMPVSTTQVGSGNQLQSWTDRLRVPLHPSCLHEIPGWEMDPSRFPYGRQRGAPEGQDNEFSLVSEGLEQFGEASKQDGFSADDYLDATFRSTLEKCDQLGGVNIVTDLGGWAGFAGAYLEILRDDFIPKAPVFTWAMSRRFSIPRLPLAVRQSRLQALATFSEFSSLVIPVQDSHANDFEANADQHMATFETICLMSSLRQKPISMHQLSEELTFDRPNANIIQTYSPIEELDATPKHIRNTLTIQRSAHRPSEDSIDTNSDGISVKTKHWCPQPYKTVPFLEAKFELNDNPLKLRKLVQHGNNELKDLIYDLTDDYIWHWEEDSEDDDF